MRWQVSSISTKLDRQVSSISANFDMRRQVGSISAKLDMRRQVSSISANFRWDDKLLKYY
jgi:ABC-type molybdenum transport system ATPase subunit/photorepair protein PhrA